MQPQLGPTKKNGATVLGCALEIKDGNLPPEAARFVLNLGVRKEHKKRLLDLLAKHQEQQITAEELEELDSYVEADNLLSILKAQALLALKKAGHTPEL